MYIYMYIPVHCTLLRLDVSARMPGLGAPRDSMKADNLSLGGMRWEGGRGVDKVPYAVAILVYREG